MLVSCIAVTQPSRLARLRDAVCDFRAQSHAPRELVVVHDGGDAFTAAIGELCDAARVDDVRIVDVAPGAPLGALRNAGVVQARGDLVCQWDDDDRYHPRRIELQLAALLDGRADACFLADQLHWHVIEDELTWDDWDREPYPLNFVQGTLLARRDRLPRYPEAVRGEDTALCLAMLAADLRIARLRDVGWCYVYVSHGDNAFSRAHHRAISAAKALGTAAIVARERVLRARLAEYDPPIGPAAFRHALGEIVIGGTVTGEAA